MTHRDDVQILRGIAVLLVVLFHIGLTDFGSGFLGVDVFFVISGYLMARMYDPRKPGQFFRRRARRLLPAYFGTIVATLMAALVLTTPNELDQVIDQAWYAVLFSSNIGFWAANSYFDKAEFKPLLHLWSLGVEIQFYALVPLLALFVRRLKRGMRLQTDPAVIYGRGAGVSGPITSSQLDTVSYGKEVPVNEGHDEAAWAENRRVEAVIDGVVAE